MCVMSLFGFILILLALLACGVGFVAPYWVHYPKGFAAEITQLFDTPLMQSFASFEHVGLLSWCYPKNKCDWFWEDNFRMESVIPDWYKAAQALYAFGFVILLSTVLLALLHVCCRCCCQKALSLATVIGSLIIAGFVLIAAAIGVFAVYQKELKGYTGTFEWGFFVAIGGVGVALLASVLFICEGCRFRSSPEGYESARMI